MRDTDFVDKAYDGEDFSNLNKLTLIIPTYSRNYYLSRCLWYHAHFPFGQIIVADSSPEEKKVINRKTVEIIRSIFGTNILYLEYEPETDKHGGDIYQKWADAIMHVETEFSQIATDKEFILPDALNKHVEFLQKNRDYVACIGRRERVMLKDDMVKIKYYPHLSTIDDSTGDTRYFKAITQPHWAYSHLHATMPSNIQKQTYKLLDTYNIADIRYGELTLGYTSHLFGKTKYLCNNYRIRDLTHYLAGNKKTESSTQRYSFFDEYEREISKDYYNRYIHCIVTEFSKKNIICGDETIKEMVPESLIIGFNSSERSRKIAKIGSLMDIYDKLPHILQMVPLKIIIKIFNAYPLLGPRNPIGNSEIVVTKIISSTSSDYDSDRVISYLN